MYESRMKYEDREKPTHQQLHFFNKNIGGFRSDERCDWYIVRVRINQQHKPQGLQQLSEDTSELS